jgi:hypothetical protein
MKMEPVSRHKLIQRQNQTSHDSLGAESANAWILRPPGRAQTPDYAICPHFQIRHKHESPGKPEVLTANYRSGFTPR